MPNTFKVGSYNGKPTCSVLTGISRDGQEFWFTFGLSKAKAILEHTGEIEDWVIEQEEKAKGKRKDNGSDAPF